MKLHLNLTGKISKSYSILLGPLAVKLPQFLILLSLLPILLNIVPLFFSGTDAAARPSKNPLKQCETQRTSTMCIIITEKDMTQLINDQVLTHLQVDHLLQYHNHIPYTEPTAPTDPPVPPKEQKEPSCSQSQTQTEPEAVCNGLIAWRAYKQFSFFLQCTSVSTSL